MRLRTLLAAICGIPALFMAVAIGLWVVIVLLGIFALGVITGYRMRGRPDYYEALQDDQQAEYETETSGADVERDFWQPGVPG